MNNYTNINIPSKYKHMIDTIYKDCDGYWVECAEGYWSSSMECGTIHEYTQREVLLALRDIERIK